MINVNRRSTIVCLAILTSIVTTLMIFAPALAAEGTVLNGLNTTFGIELANIFGIAQGNILFNFLSFLAYFLPLLAALTLLLCDSKYTGIYAIILNLAALILFALMPTYVKLNVSVLNQASIRDVAWILEWGTITAIVLCIISIILSAYHVYKALKEDRRANHHR